MKPAPFDYEAPTSLDAALALLAEADARPLAGGQSLIPLMNFRLAFPSLLVDLNPVAELAEMCASDGGGLRIGAMTRQATLHRSPEVARGWPLLTEAVGHVGHAATRSRGTVGGSVAHADPAAELPVALTALDARFHLRSAAGPPRTLTTTEFFTGAMTTALRSGELLVEIEVPAPPSGARMAFLEFARTHGDFAMAGVAVVVVPGGPAAVALLGAAHVPVRARAVERALAEGAEPAEAAALLAADGADAAGAADGADDHRRALLTTYGADDHRRGLLMALTRRALERVVA